MTKKEVRQQMRTLSKKMQDQPISTPEERKAFHQLQDEYNQLAAKFWSLV